MKIENLPYGTVRELAAALRDRTISATELLTASIARIESYDAQLNAVVVRDFERARAAAREADAALARGDRRPLLGIPMTIKESFDIAGLPTTWGAPWFRDFRPAEDAAAVARLKAAGAVVMGKTNVPFMLSDWQSYNEVYGTTRNPWNPERSAGGSSGGAAVALAAGYVALELGSDIGGSIRVPAHFNGVFGHKSSYDLVPGRGHVPPPGGDAKADMAVAGPMARSAADLALALDVLAGPDTDTAHACRIDLPAARHDNLSGYRALTIDDHPMMPVDGDVRGAIEKLAAGLTKAGAKVSRSSELLPDLAHATRVYMRLLCATIFSQMPPDFYRAVESQVAALDPSDTSLYAERLRGTILSHRDWLAADAERSTIGKQWRALFEHFDVVLAPVMPTAAFPHDHLPDQESRRIRIDGREFRYFDQLAWPGIATLCGLPATVAPIERTRDGLPVGVQIIGPYLEDRTTIEFAGLIEREFGGFVAPPGY